MNHFSEDDLTPEKDVLCSSCHGVGEDVMLLRCTGCDGTGLKKHARTVERKPGPSAIDLAIREMILRTSRKSS